MPCRTSYVEILGTGLLCFGAVFPVCRAQVFTVGEHSATAGLADTFERTNVGLPGGKLNERGRRELESMLVAEQGFAHRALPLGPGLVLVANGATTPDGERYRKLLYNKGQSAAVGDRVVITAVEIKGDRMVLDFNGGPYAKHRFLSHIQLNGGNVATPQQEATGTRVTLVFPRGIPEITAPDVKALLQPIIDFGVKSSEEAYADTLPPRLRDAIAAHEVLVGMNRRMVLAALGQPGSKLREREGDQGQNAQYEEWIYGQVPEKVSFVRFRGDRVSQLKIAEVGRPVLVRTQDEVGGYNAPPPTREILLGDRKHGSEDEPQQSAAAPTLRRPGEPAPADGGGRVQMPANAPAGTAPATPH